MFKNRKVNFKKIAIGTSVVIILCSLGLIISKEISRPGNKTIESVNGEENVSKGFEDIESIEIGEVYMEDGKTKIKNNLIIENTVELEEIMSLFNKKIPLPNEYYCALYDNQFTINKKDGTKEEYTVLIGNKHILINDKAMNHRIEDEDIVVEFGKFFK